jgi:branched-chain amino acid transport system permease protein/urea transport system permease protein
MPARVRAGINDTWFPMDSLLVTLLNGISLTMVLLLISLGLAIIFGLRGVINLAHGEFFMLGAYAMVLANQFLPDFWGGLIVAPLLVALIGWAVERGMIRFLYERPLDTLLATWGLSIVLRELIKNTVGAGYQYTRAPFTGQAHFLGIEYPVYRLFIIGFSSLVLAVVFYLFLRTDLGMQIRAAIANRDMAASLGIRTERLDQFVFALGAGLAGLAGAVMSPVITLHPEMGLDFFAQTFFVVIIGGIGSLWGMIPSAAIIGGAVVVMSTYIRPIVAQILVLSLAILVIRVRPRGLFQR